ncbi:MAG: DUF1491 family protein [Hyphomicrobiaceae bacterium]|jgi:hypothetical protein|nr:DUF1491 family protein [Methyloceanibacter sp.]MDX2317755.1 DUF1491 family protein [Hyphomicrobiaceae bacterium]MDX2449783.1 DUF1491 family protein [Hyphomicrobiaceae bacterium]
MRVKSEIWVGAYLRRCQAEAIPAVIVRRGDGAAGAIYVSIDRLDGTVCLYGPAPAGLDGAETDRRWVRCLGASPVVSSEASIYLARQLEFDSDLWIVEVEDRAGRHFLGDDAVED